MTLPPGHQPADVTSKGLQAHHVKLNTYSTHAIHIEQAQFPPTTLAEALQRESENSYWAVEKVEQFPGCADEGLNVAEAIIRGDCRGVTDASYKDNKATA